MTLSAEQGGAARGFGGGIIVIEPVGAEFEDAYRGGAQLLAHFAQGRLTRRFAVLQPALRHLPGMSAIVAAPAGKYLATRIDEDDSYTGAVVGGAEHGVPLSQKAEGNLIPKCDQKYKHGLRS